MTINRGMKLLLLIVPTIVIVTLVNYLNRSSITQVFDNSKSHFGYRSKVVQLGELSFHYVEAGEGKIILFLHGFPFFGESWDQLLKPFSKHYRVIAPDLRGYGYTDKPSEVAEYKIDKLVEDVRLLINQLNNEQQKISIIGHDWGGVLAWGVTQQYPDLVYRLVVINAPPFNAFIRSLQLNESQREASKYITKMKSPLAPAYLYVKGPELFWGAGFKKLHNNGHLDDSFKNTFLHYWDQQDAAVSAINWYKANMPDFDQIDQSSYWPNNKNKIVVPSLLIWSSNDRAFTRDTFNEIPYWVENLTIEEIDTDSHAPFLDHGDKIRLLIERFMAD